MEIYSLPWQNFKISDRYLINHGDRTVSHLTVDVGPRLQGLDTGTQICYHLVEHRRLRHKGFISICINSAYGMCQEQQVLQFTAGPRQRGNWVDEMPYAASWLCELQTVLHRDGQQIQYNLFTCGVLQSYCDKNACLYIGDFGITLKQIDKMSLVQTAQVVNIM